MIDFSVNVTPLGIPDNIKKAMEESLERAGWYPDDSKFNLKHAISEKYHILPDWICMGNGASDVIFRLVFALRPKRAVVLAPTFAEYEAALRCVDAKIDHYAIDHKDFKVKSDLLDMIQKDTDILFLCNPNNPTGLLMTKAQVEEVLLRCEETDTWLAVDECFLEFVEDGETYSVMDHLKDHPKLCIIKSFTKMFGIAGLRLGYLLCSKEGMADRVDHFGCDWNINCVAEAAGLEALKSEAYEEEVRSYIAKERKWLREALLGLNLKVIDGRANYLLFKASKADREPLGEWLLKRGIMIRCCDDYENMTGDYYRIGINTHEMNCKLVEEIGGWMR